MTPVPEAVPDLDYMEMPVPAVPTVPTGVPMTVRTYTRSQAVQKAGKAANEKSAVVRHTNNVIRLLNSEEGLIHPTSGKVCDRVLSYRAIHGIGGNLTSQIMKKKVFERMQKHGYGVIKNGSFHLDEKYRRDAQKTPPADNAMAEVERVKNEAIDALTNSLNFTKPEARKMYENSTGDTVDERIKSALKSKGNEVR